MDEIKQLLTRQNDAFAAFKNANEADRALLKQEIKSLQGEIDNLQKRMQRPGAAPHSRTEAAAKQQEIDQFLRGKSDRVFGHKALTIGGLPEDGGYADTEEVQPSVLQLDGIQSPMRQVSLVTKRSTDNPEQIVDVKGEGGGRVAETDARPETNTPQLSSVTPLPVEYYANPRASQKMIDDAFFDVSSWLANAINRKFAELENVDFTAGNGTDKPKGFLAYTLAANPTFGQLKQIKSGAAGLITADKLIEVANESLKPDYLQGARWMMPRAMLTQIRQLKDSNNRYLFDHEARTLLGFPITLNDNMPTPAADSNSLAFGDFNRGYWIADHVTGTRVLVDPYTAKPYVQYYATKRTAGGVLDSQAICIVTLGV